MNITGKLEVKNKTSQVSESFCKRGFVIEYADNPTYPQLIQLEFIQDKCGLLDGFNVGDIVSVEYNLQGRKWVSPKGEDIYFNTLQAWRIAKGSGTHDLTPEHTAANNIASGSASPDLPF